MSEPLLSASEIESLVLKHFGFLINEYKFTYKKFDDWTYDLENRTTKVHILCEHYMFLSISIEPLGKSAEQLTRKNITIRNGLPLVVISMCLDPDLKYKIERYEGSVATNIPIELEKESNLLKSYCTKMLKGDFSQWEGILECKAKRRHEFIRL
jgi:hypothetical protein